MGDERAFNPQGGLRGRTNSAGDLATTSTSGGGGAQAGTADWVIFRRRTGVSPYRHSSQQYTASRAPSEHVGAIMNRVTSYLACRVQCATERAIGSPSEATRANNGHIPAPCSDPNGRPGPCSCRRLPRNSRIVRVSHTRHPDTWGHLGVSKYLRFTSFTSGCWYLGSWRRSGVGRGEKHVFSTVLPTPYL